MAVFVIDTDTGQVATRKQLIEAGIASPAERSVPPPWHPIQGPSDASTMWYAVMRKRERGVFIGALVLRHQGRDALLADRGWAEVPVGEIGVSSTETGVSSSGPRKLGSAADVTPSDDVTP
jgi:hypothetical protein